MRIKRPTFQAEAEQEQSSDRERAAEDSKKTYDGDGLEIAHGSDFAQQSKLYSKCFDLCTAKARSARPRALAEP